MNKADKDDVCVVHLLSHQTQVVGFQTQITDE